MKRLQGFKFELRPSGAQKRKMIRFSGACRFVYNKTLSLQKEKLESEEKLLSYVETAGLLVDWKQEDETCWLKDAPSQSLQQSLGNLDRALGDAFNKKSPKKFPKFHKKGGRDSFRYPQGFKIEEHNSRICLPKLGWIRYRKSRDVTGVPKNITVSRYLGKWYVSIQTEQKLERPVHPSTSIIGIDLGVARFATLSDGSYVPSLNIFRKLQDSLAFQQRRLSHKKRFSSNWKKQKIKIQRIHRKIANSRNDFLHKASTQISKNHAIIVIEDLNVSGMSKSSKGSIGKPGKNVKSKSGLNKSILDQGWGRFRKMLKYKQKWLGGELIAVHPAYTSQTCSSCKHLDKDSRKSQSVFFCTSCGHRANADHNAAQNILAAGHAVLACGVDGLPSAMNQEPAEATGACSGAVGIPVL